MSIKSSIIILAAGKGTRMDSQIPKVLHPIDSNNSLLTKLLESVSQIAAEEIYIVVGYKKELVIQHIKEWLSQKDNSLNIKFVEQLEQKGTGHAVQSVAPYIQNKTNQVLLLLGDVPNITVDTINTIFSKLNSNDAIVASVYLDNPYGYGRIIRGSTKQLSKIIEEKDATQEIKMLKEVNTGIMAFKGEVLWKHLQEINCNNNQGEFYITEIIKILSKKNYHIVAHPFDNHWEFLGINSQNQLRKLQETKI